MAILLNGKEKALQIEEDLKQKVELLKTRLGFTPKFATILVGDNPASITYIKMKTRAMERIGMGFEKVELPENSTTQMVLDEIERLNNDKTICGILLQHPAPSHIDETACFNAIAVEKDVDGVNSTSFGNISLSGEGFKSATPYGIMKLLELYDIDVVGKNAVVVGRSAILGKPVAMLLLNANATVTICHSKTKNLEEIVSRADIVVGAVGKPKFIQADWLKDGAIVIDAGYNPGNVGDIDYEPAIPRLFAYTPVPGGVGPMTIAMLLTQTVESAERLLTE